MDRTGRVCAPAACEREHTHSRDGNQARQNSGRSSIESFSRGHLAETNEPVSVQSSKVSHAVIPAELHHPLRDGRPPLPLSKSGHARIEGQDSANDDDPRVAALQRVRNEGNRSWAMLRRGCLDLLGLAVTHSTPKVAASSKTFARKAAEASGMSFEQIIEWLDGRGLGVA